VAQGFLEGLNLDIYERLDEHLFQELFFVSLEYLECWEIDDLGLDTDGVIIGIVLADVYLAFHLEGEIDGTSVCPLSWFLFNNNLECSIDYNTDVSLFSDFNTGWPGVWDFSFNI